MKYKIIYADPPWLCDSQQDKHNGKPVHYSCMDLEAIKSLRVKQLCDDNCALFLWSIPALLKEAIEVGEAWGFKYKTKGFCWLKKNKKADSFFFGQGYYTRSNTEGCLLFLRGRMKRINNSVRQVIATPIEAHSKKPEEARTRIVQLFGDIPRLEMFARQKTPGWHVWGNEVASDVIL